MKNATRYCAGPAYYRMCSTDVYCSKQTGSSSTKGNHHPSLFLELRKKTAPRQNQAAINAETNQRLGKWDCLVLLLRH